MDPYNKAANATAPADPFEDSLTLAANRLQALQRVKRAQEILRDRRAIAAADIERAEREVANAIVDASRIGAYSLVPEGMRPDDFALRMAAASAGGAA